MTDSTSSANSEEVLNESTESLVSKARFGKDPKTGKVCTGEERQRASQELKKREINE